MHKHLSGYFLSILRIVAALLFLSHGLQKTFGLFGGHQMPITSIFGIAGCIEIVGGILFLLGLFTRPVAFVLCGEMASAYFIAHFPKSPVPIISGGELAVLYCFVFLYFIFAGAGPISIDRFRSRV